MTDYLKMFTNLPNLSNAGGRIRVVKGKDSSIKSYFMPNLYHMDNKWCVSWFDSSNCNFLVGVDADTPEEVIQKAYKYCVDKNYIKA